MVRMLPMFVTGIVCNVIIALIIGRVNVLYIIGMLADQILYDRLVDAFDGFSIWYLVNEFR